MVISTRETRATGGGVYVAGGAVDLSNDNVQATGGTVTLTSCTVQCNIASAANIYIDPFTPGQYCRQHRFIRHQR